MEFSDFMRPFGINGMTMLGDLNMVDIKEDWSEVRSPARAKRRRARGFIQNINYISVPKPDLYRLGNTLFGHPITVDKIMAALKERQKSEIDHQLNAPWRKKGGA